MSCPSRRLAVVLVFGITLPVAAQNCLEPAHQWLGPDTLRGIAVAQQHTYLAAGGHGLLVLDVTNPANPQEVGLLSPVAGEVRDVVVVEDMAYVLEDGLLRSVDISSPSSPSEIGAISTVDAEKLAVTASYAYVASEQASRIIDVSDPTQPVSIGSLPGGGGRDIEVEGGVAHLTRDNELHLIDVTDPTQPCELAVVSIDVPPYENPDYCEGVGVFAGLAWVVVCNVWVDEYGCELIGVDTRDPSSPRIIDSNQAVSIWERGEVAALDGATLVADRYGIYVVDTSDPTTPSVLGSRQLFVPYASDSLAIVSDGTSAFVVADNSLEIYDLTECDITPPQFQAEFTWAPTTPEIGEPTYLRDLSSGNPQQWSWQLGDDASSDARGPVHVFSEPGDKLVVLTVSDGTDTDTVFHTVTVLPPSVTDFEGDVAPRTEGGDSRVDAMDVDHVVDFSLRRDTPIDGGELRRADCAPRSESGNGVVSVADTVQVRRYQAHLDPLTPAGGPTATALQYSEISSAELAGSCPESVGRWIGPGSARAIAVSGTTACVALRGDGLQLLDVSVPAQPLELGWVEGSVEDVVASADLALAVGHDGLRIIDISDPTAPFLLDMLSEPTGKVIDVSGHHAYILGSQLYAVNISDPAAATVVGTTAVEGEEMSVSGDFAAVVRYPELALVDISNPSRPRVCGQVTTPFAESVAIDGHYAYVAGTNCGMACDYALSTFDITDPYHLQLVSQQSPGYVGGGLAVSGSLLFVSGAQGLAWGSGLFVMDLTDPARPAVLGYGQPPNSPGGSHGVAVVGNFALLANSEEGVEVLDLGPCLTPPIAAFASSPQSVTAGDLIEFEDQSTGGPLSWSWDFGGGRKSVSRNPVHTFSAPGTYSVTLTVSNSLGTSSASADIDVGEANSSTDVRLKNSTCSRGETVVVPVSMEAVGGENAAALSIQFDPSVLQYAGVTPGTSMSTALVSDYVMAPGRLGLLAALPAGESLAMGSHTMLRLSFATTPGVIPMQTRIAVDTLPVPGEVADFLGNPRPSTFDGCTVTMLESQDLRTVVVPAAAHNPGANGTTWVTDLVVHNPGAQPATANLLFLRRDRDNTSAVAVPITVPAGASVRSEDVVSQTFGHETETGAILVEGVVPLLVSSRTYNQSAAGTYGQGIPGVDLIDATVAGQQTRLVQLGFSPDRSTGYRTNIGFVNASGVRTGVDIQLHRGDGTFLGTVSRVLVPWTWRQFHDIFRQVTDEPVADGFALVSSSTPGARYFAYASVVDNTTGDPMFGLAREVQ